MPKPWLAQKGDTLKSFEAFTLYLEMGNDRSLAKVGQELVKSRALMLRWSARDNWVERAKAWDSAQEERKRNAELDEVAKMGKRHAQQAQATLQTLMLPVMAILKKLQENPALVDLRDVPIHLLLELADSASSKIANVQKAERLARGEPTDIQGGAPSTVINIINATIEHWVTLFQDVNAIEDPEQRARAFALGADKIVDAKLKGAISERESE